MENFKMEFNERLRALRTRSSMTQKELSDAINVSVVTIRNWELGTKRPSMSAIISLADVFNVTTDYMLGVSHNQVMDCFLMSPREKLLLSDYRLLDDYGKKAVDAICKLEKFRVSSESIRYSGNHKTDKSHEQQKPIRYIPKYFTPSAAGISAPLDGDDFEMILVDDNIPSSADFAVEIQGDSMSPYIRDKETVFVKKTTELSVGDVGIFSVDGALYCKQYYIDNLGNLTLISSNPLLRNTNIVVRSDSDSSVVCYGRVLLDAKIPLPEYFTKHE